MKLKLKMLLLKLALTNEERGFIASGLTKAEEKYREEYSFPKYESYHSKTLKENLPKLVQLKELFRSICNK